MADDSDAALRTRQEAALRRQAARLGLVIRKSRARDDCRMDYGCFRIESKDGLMVAGTYPYPYSLTLQGAAEALEQLMDAPRSWPATSGATSSTATPAPPIPTGGNDMSDPIRVRVFSDYI